MFLNLFALFPKSTGMQIALSVRKIYSLILDILIPIIIHNKNPLVIKIYIFIDVDINLTKKQNILIHKTGCKAPKFTI